MVTFSKMLQVGMISVIFLLISPIMEVWGTKIGNFQSADFHIITNLCYT